MEIASLQPQEHHYKTEAYLANTATTFQMCKRRLDKFEESDES